ncbi:MAG: MFS transporter, partial [Ilumatobacteraceae bacterium]
LGLQAARFGALLTAGALGGVIGSFTAAKISSRFGPGASLFTTLLVSAGTALATGLTSSALVVWVMFVLSSFVSVLWNVITVSLRQTIIPPSLLGRVNSVYRFFAWGMIPIGAAIGGVWVWSVERLVDREFALRSTWFVVGAIHAVLFVVGRSKLTTERLEAARAAATAPTAS